MAVEVDEDPLDGETPLAYILTALADKAADVPVDEERLTYAVSLVMCATLVSRGLEPDTAIQAIEQAMSHGDIRIHYSEGEGLEINIGEGISADGPSIDAMHWSPEMCADGS